ncbi:RsmD family RNA methyltransferase [soil metagenome]
MRIIGGTLKGRKFYPPYLSPTRPTTDFAKEALYNILYNVWDFEGLKFLDLFAGTGGHSYEFVSRGAARVVSVDAFGESVAYIKKMALEFNVADRLTVVQSDVFRFIDTCTDEFDIIFAGPPYKLDTLDTIPDYILSRGLLPKGGWLILEHNPDHDFTGHPNFIDLRKYGTTYFCFFEA